ncbi:MAG TPA: ZIP family metal transporter [Verrucomicrobiae bacterium]|nr:ZIP family metal transporter [Verrucomicrobiae bacterium]
MEYIILLSSIVLGAVVVFAFKLHEPRHVKVLNSFTGAFLLSLTLLHLLPELYHDHDHDRSATEQRITEQAHDHEHPPGDSHVHGEPKAPRSMEQYALLLGALMLGGFFVQLALDFISMGIEHGHSHHLHGHAPYGVVAGLCIHAFVEALALGNPLTTYNPESRHLLLLSIVVHNFPVSIALLGMLLHWGLPRNRALGVLALFAAMAPIGMFLSGHFIWLADHSRELMAIVIGIFMHISTTILFESSDAHKIHTGKLAAIILGTVLGVVTVMLH